MDLIVRGRFARAGRVEELDVAVEAGRIVKVARHLTGAPVLDARGMLVMPGGIDPHVHFRDPGHPEKEDWGSGSRSAAFGGVTTVLDMPNTNPPTITRAAFADKRARASAKSLVDFGIYAGLAGDESIEILSEATALKTYLGATTGDLLARDPAMVAKALARAHALGKVAAFHAEDQTCLEHHHLEERASADFEAHSRARPASCERRSIDFVKSLKPPPGTRVHVCHLSSAEGLDALAGTGFTCEVTPHHLYLTRDALRHGGNYKMNPPLRPEADREALWTALLAGKVDCLASDHAPHTPTEKGRGVWEAPAGVPGVETMIPLLMAEVARGRLDAGLLARVSAERAGEIYGLPKGRIAEGYDADFAFYDLSRIEPIRADRLHSRAGWTPFEGMNAIFPSRVMLCGRILLDEGALVDEKPRGRFLPGGEGINTQGSSPRV